MLREEMKNILLKPRPFETKPLGVCVIWSNYSHGNMKR